MRIGDGTSLTLQWTPEQNGESSLTAVPVVLPLQEFEPRGDHLFDEDFRPDPVIAAPVDQTVAFRPIIDDRDQAARLESAQYLRVHDVGISKPRLYRLIEKHKLD